MVESYEFHDRLQMSAGVSVSADVKAILLNNIPGALNAFQAQKENDRDGTDWWIECAGQFISVDCKVRERDFAASHGQDDLALETWSNVERRGIGWTRDVNKRTDYVLWVWKDTGRWCLIPFKMLCHVFGQKWEAWKGQYKTARQFTPVNGSGYHSECTFVPRREVWSEIYKAFGGHVQR